MPDTREPRNCLVVVGDYDGTLEEIQQFGPMTREVAEDRADRLRQALERAYRTSDKGQTFVLPSSTFVTIRTIEPWSSVAFNELCSDFRKSGEYAKQEYRANQDHLIAEGILDGGVSE